MAGNPLIGVYDSYHTIYDQTVRFIKESDTKCLIIPIAQRY